MTRSDAFVFGGLQVRPPQECPKRGTLRIGPEDQLFVTMLKINVLKIDFKVTTKNTSHVI